MLGVVGVSEEFSSWFSCSSEFEVGFEEELFPEVVQVRALLLDLKGRGAKR